MTNKYFPYLVGLSALLVAGSAAWFSVFGLSKLFAGATWQVIIMASSLEFSKLVAASFLYRYWHQLNILMKLYLTIGVIILVLITSAGIFGYLSNAYQGATLNLDKINSKTLALDQTKLRLYDERNRISNGINMIRTERQHTIENRNTEISSMTITDTTRYYDRLQRQKIYNRYQLEVESIENNISKLNISLDKININIATTEQELSVLKLEMIESGVDVGPVIYIAKAFNVHIDTVVKFFILILIFVFDPLAVVLVISTNLALVNKNKSIIQHSTKIEKLYQTYQENKPSKEIDRPKENIEPDKEPEKTQMKHNKSSVIGRDGVKP